MSRPNGKMPVLSYIHGGTRGWLEVMEGMVVRNERSFREGVIGTLASVRPKYVHDHVWRDAVTAQQQRLANSGTAACWLAAELRHRGQPAVLGFQGGNAVVISGGKVIDPSLALGRRPDQSTPMIGSIPGNLERGRIQEHMLITIDDHTAQAVCEIGDAIAGHNARLIREGWKIPPLYESGVRYQVEGSPEQWLDAPAMIERGWDDCEGMAAYRAGELMVEGLDAHVWTRLIEMPATAKDFGAAIARSRLFHAITVVRMPDGRSLFDDPSVRTGMPVPVWYQKWANQRRAEGKGLDADSDTRLRTALSTLSARVHSGAFFDFSPNGPLVVENPSLTRSVALTLRAWCTANGYDFIRPYGEPTDGFLMKPNGREGTDHRGLQAAIGNQERVYPVKVNVSQNPDDGTFRVLVFPRGSR